MTAKVLLVDDVADVRRLVRIALRFHGGFEVVGEARAGVEAVELAGSLQPDIVLLDLGLPDLAGREVLTGIREVAPSAKVVVFTGTDDDRAWFEERAAGYVLKDAELDYLVGLLEDVGRSSEREVVAEFGADTATVADARDFVRRTLVGWGAGATHDAELVVTELATNAVVHAGTAYAVRLSSSGQALVRIEVSDSGPGTPEPQPYSSSSEGGRGIVLVSAISTSWGIEQAEPVGKTTWAELAL